MQNLNFRLGMIFAMTVLSILVVLPRIPISINNKWLKLDTSVGGYFINLGKWQLDLRDIKKGLDLEGGIKVVLRADMSKIADDEKSGALESAKEVIDRRVNLLGVTEPFVATSKVGDEYRIIVEIPGIDNVSEAINLIGQTAQLKFKTLKKDLEWTQDKYLQYVSSPDSWEDSGVTGADMKGADVVVAQGGDISQQGKPQIQLKFTNEGRTKFSELAKTNIGKPIALYLDEDSFPISAPTVSEDLATGLISDPVISGNFTFESAKTLAIQLRSGALPIPVEVLEQKTVGATLGGESIQKSFLAGVVGLILVFAFLVLRYRFLGILSGISLIIYSFIVLAIFKIIPVVLTLPGIAGFILSIGMATDACILIFERTREEIRWGKPRNLAIKLGFERAWNSIKDSNVSSLITSFILFQFGSGSVRGFALTLAIGIFVSLFTSIFVVKTFIEATNFGQLRRPKHE